MTKYANEDWELLRRLAEHVGDAAETPAEPVRDLLRRVAPTVAIPSEACDTALATSAETANLVRDIRQRIRDGSDRLAKAMLRAGELRGRGRREEARQVWRDFVRDESIPFYREIGESEIGRVAGPMVFEHVMAYSPGGEGPPQPAAVRISEPAREGDAWVARMEIAGLGREGLADVRGGDWFQAIESAVRLARAFLKGVADAGGVLDPPLQPRNRKQPT